MSRRSLSLLSPHENESNPKLDKRSGEGWEHVQHVSFTKDLGSDLSHFSSTRGPDDVAHVRAMSFSYPQKAVMSDFADGWRARAAEAGGPGGAGGWGPAPGPSAAAEAGDGGLAFDEDDDEDMDDDDLDDYLQMMAESRAAVSSSSQPLFVDAASASDDVVSPFDAGSVPASVKPLAADGEGLLELTKENVDGVLDEVRPYLISDGGNVSVKDVDADTGNVYLVLEGACGSCASSTVTMKMGIERVLLEKFGSKLGEVVQVDDEGAGGEGGGGATELTVESVQAEVNRMSNAMVAMGAVVRVVGVDPVGVAEIEFRGPNKVKKGLELALLDVEYCKHVKFVS